MSDNSRFLSDSGWKDYATKNKIKDNGLLKSLVDYKRLGDDEYDDRLEGIAEVGRLAGLLSRAKEVVAIPAVVDYLSDVVSAARSEEREIAKAKALAEKAQATTSKQVAAETKKRDQEADEDEDQGDYPAKLLAAFQRLKGTKELAYQFLVCDAKPHCGVAIAKRITPKHKEELTRLTGGGKRFLKIGTCRVENGKLTFEMDEPPAGLARRIQTSINNFTGKTLPVRVGSESAEDGDDLSTLNPDLVEGGQGTPTGGPEAGTSASGPLALGGSVGRGGKNQPEDVKAVQEALNSRVSAGLTVDGKCGSKTIAAIEDFQGRLGQSKPDGLVVPQRGAARALATNAKLGPPPPPPEPIPPPKLGKATLAKAPAVWHDTRRILETNIEELKKGVRGHYGSEHPELLNEVEVNMVKLGRVLEKLDDRLVQPLEQAQAAETEQARQTALKNAKSILADYIKYVKSEPLIAQMDSNPFGVQTDLKKVLMDSLTHMAQAIG